MGLMDQLGQAAGGLMGGQSVQNPLVQAMIALLGKDSGIGGLTGVVQAFQKNGLGELINSWVSTGRNLPATPSQIEQGLGGDLLNQLAGKAGLSSDAASSQLAGLLPDLIDRLTPDGKVEAGGLDQLMKLVQGKMGA
ncbi:MAG: YidB family protein [Nitrospira sp.]